jgi:hypothetical protein
MIRILKGSRQPKNSVIGDEWSALRSLKATGLLTVFSADIGNDAVVLGTSDYNQNIAILLQNKAYAKLKKDPTECIESKSDLLLKKSSFAEVCRQVRPQSCRQPGLCGLPNTQIWCAIKTHREHHWFSHLPLGPTLRAST